MKQKLLAAILLFMGLSGAALAQSQGSSVAVTSWAGGALGAMANFGSSPGAVLVPGVNAYVTGSGPTAAGTNIIGKVGIDQTTDGTTNGVRLTTEYPAGSNRLLPRQLELRVRLRRH